MNTLRVAILTGVAALTALPALAQTSPYARGARQSPAYEAYGAYRGEPSYGPRRGNDVYSAPRGYGGTITSTTPNADGNLGGPSAGGGAGATGG